MSSTARLTGLVASAAVVLIGLATGTGVLAEPLSTTELTGLAAMALGAAGGLASAATRRRGHDAPTA